MGMVAPKQFTNQGPLGSIGFENGSVSQSQAAPQLQAQPMLPMNPIPDQLPAVMPVATAPNAVPKPKNPNPGLHDHGGFGGYGIGGGRFYNPFGGQQFGPSIGIGSGMLKPF